MGEARRRRLAGEPPGPRLEAGQVRMLDPDEAPDLPGCVRVTLLDDDDEGCTAYLEAGKVADILARVGELPFAGRRVREAESDLALWSRLRIAAFDMARVKRERENEAAAFLGLWCATRGPLGTELRREMSDVLGRAGKVAVVMRRHRPSKGVAAIVAAAADGLTLEQAAAAAEMGGKAPGCIVAVLNDDEPRVEH